MKKYLQIISLIFLVVFGSSAQNITGLELKNYKTQDSRFVENGTKVKIIKNGITYKGNLNVISDQAITVDSDTLLLTEVRELWARTTSRTVGGLALAAPSALFGAGGLALIIAGIAEGDGYGFIGIILGIPVVTAGAIGVYFGSKLTKGKKFNASSWQFLVANPVTSKTIK